MAIEIVDLPRKMVIFHSYVSLPEGNIGLIMINTWRIRYSLGISMNIPVPYLKLLETKYCN